MRFMGFFDIVYLKAGYIFPVNYLQSPTASIFRIDVEDRKRGLGLKKKNKLGHNFIVRIR